MPRQSHLALCLTWQIECTCTDDHIPVHQVILTESGGGHLALGQCWNIIFCKFSKFKQQSSTQLLNLYEDFWNLRKLYIKMSGKCFCINHCESPCMKVKSSKLQSLKAQTNSIVFLCLESWQSNLLLFIDL